VRNAETAVGGSATSQPVIASEAKQSSLAAMLRFVVTTFDAPAQVTPLYLMRWRPAPTLDCFASLAMTAID
jgi:hypothetical protein